MSRGDVLRSVGVREGRGALTVTRFEYSTCQLAAVWSRKTAAKAPTIVLHGANDTNVPVIEAEQVVESLKKRNVPVEYVLFPDEGHGWRKTPNRIRAAVAIVKFFEKHLKGS